MRKVRERRLCRTRKIECCAVLHEKLPRRDRLSRTRFPGGHSRKTFWVFVVDEVTSPFSGRQLGLVTSSTTPQLRIDQVPGRSARKSVSEQSSRRENLDRQQPQQTERNDRVAIRKLELKRSARVAKQSPFDWADQSADERRQSESAGKPPQLESAETGFQPVGDERCLPERSGTRRTNPAALSSKER